MSDLLANYDEQVYAAVLGKIIGVYMGRPFEGWDKAKIEEKWGQIDRYVNEDVGHDLVVADDDITGTFTFVRALEDCGKYENATAQDFADTWMNYLIENKTILWWGGMGHSTEHTAYLRLKNGITAPESGSCALNGKTVSEQIGAQIFIDAIGMCFPGEPERAAAVAEHAARVSHDGEAVYAAQIVAAMVAMAFVEKDLFKIMDHCVTLIPADSLMAQIHKDVRAWAVEDKDWQRTFERIDQRYGYHAYGGNCHVVPNHAIMVMAWAYAPDNFHLSQIIINTAGWDTDCNAANVGSVMGVICGLDGINQDYDYQTPFADRVLMPTAEGSRGTSDALRESEAIAAMGRKCMHWPAAEEKPWFHFSQPGALHGFRAESEHLQLNNTQCSLHIVHSAAEESLLSTPVLTRKETPGTGTYGVIGSPRLYAAYTLTAKVTDIDQDCSVKMFVRIGTHAEDAEQSILYSDVYNQASDNFTFTIPNIGEQVIIDFGFAISGKGSLNISAVDYSAVPRVQFADNGVLPKEWRATDIPGYVLDVDSMRGPFSDDDEKQLRFIKSEGRGSVVTGTDDWCDYQVSARLNNHLGDYVGLLARYQGQRRCIELRQQRAKLQLIEHDHAETVLAECDSPAWDVDVFHELKIVCHGEQITGFLDGKEVLQGSTQLTHGGAGFCFANGLIGARDFAVSADAASLQGSSATELLEAR
ncbi:MAG: ADP-ribosylglycohydrolase family protein [Planctomycetes bacterium]|nr:ADP-ribosylglycohydrolase family protein [Planctomycetota bacterium]